MGAEPGMLIPQADSHWAETAHLSGAHFSALPEGVRSLPSRSFRLPCSLSPICSASPGVVLASQIQAMGPSRAGITYFEVFCFLLKIVCV